MKGLIDVELLRSFIYLSRKYLKFAELYRDI